MDFNPDIYRKDFPPLELRFAGKPPVYLDSACSTLRPRAVMDACSRYYAEFPGCHQRGSHKFSRLATESFEGARRRVARFINAAPEEIIFVRNTTEALNLVANSFSGCAVLTTGLEHNSNLLPWLELSRKGVLGHRAFELNPDLTFSMDKFTAALDGAGLVSVPHRSHITGCEYPVSDIAEAAHGRNALLLVDGAQAAGPGGVDVKALGADFYAFSAHKMLGPSGFGVLYARRDKMDLLKPLLLGGGTVTEVNGGIYTLSKPPYRFEAGLQNYSAALGLEAAVDYLSRVDAPQVREHLQRLNSIMTEKVLGLKGARILGPEDPALRNNVINFTLAGADSLELADLLDRTENIMVRAGRHCSHDWFNSSGIRSSVRASLYFYNTEAEVRLFGETLASIVKHFY